MNGVGVEGSTFMETLLSNHNHKCHSAQPRLTRKSPSFALVRRLQADISGMN